MSPRSASPPGKFRRIVVYAIVRWTMAILCRVFFRYRVIGAENWPDGSGLVCANHQSVMDPVLAGLSYRGRLGYLARESLFVDHPVLGWLIASVDAVPIKRDGIGIGGVKSALRRLKDNKKMLIFPEGTRSADGEIQALQPGFVAVARRGNAPLIPMAIAGAFEAWPRNRSFPRLSPVRVCIGPALSAEEIAVQTDSELIAEVARRIKACYAMARASCAGKHVQEMQIPTE